VRAGSSSSRRRMRCSVGSASGRVPGGRKPGLGDEPVADPLVEPPGDDGGQQGAGVGGAEGVDEERRQPGQVAGVAGRAERENQRDRRRREPAGHEPQHLGRRTVEPLDVVDEADERSPLGHLGQEAEHRAADQEGVRVPARGQPEGRAEGVALRPRQVPQPLQQGRAQLVQAGEGDRPLGLDARRPQQAAPRGPRRHVVEQGGPADARLAPHDQGPAPPVPHVVDQPVERARLGGAPHQPGPSTPVGHRSPPGPRGSYESSCDGPGCPGAPRASDRARRATASLATLAVARGRPSAARTGRVAHGRQAHWAHPRLPGGRPGATVAGAKEGP